MLRRFYRYRRMRTRRGRRTRRAASTEPLKFWAPMFPQVLKSDDRCRCSRGVQYIDTVVDVPASCRGRFRCNGVVYEGRGRIPHISDVTLDSGQFLNEHLVSGSHSPRCTSVSLRLLSRRISQFLREGCARAVRTLKSGQYFNELFITAVGVEGGGDHFRISRPPLDSVLLDVESRIFWGALDGQKLLVSEGSRLMLTQTPL